MYPMRFIEMLELFIAWQFGPEWTLPAYSQPTLVKEHEDYLLAFTLVKNSSSPIWHNVDVRIEKVRMQHLIGYLVDEQIIMPTEKPW